MSGLTKKAVYADRVLSSILGVNEGDFVSYADISKGVHKYIKDNNLRSPQARQAAAQFISQSPVEQAKVPATRTITNCRDCGARPPWQAVFFGVSRSHQ